MLDSNTELIGLCCFSNIVMNAKEGRSQFWIEEIKKVYNKSFISNFYVTKMSAFIITDGFEIGILCFLKHIYLCR